VKVYGIFTLTLFLCSIVYPFLQVQLFGIVTFTGAPGPATFWSFKVTTIFFHTPDNPGPPVIREYWFADYWAQYGSYRTAELGLGIAFISAFMFGAQILAVLSAALACILSVEANVIVSSRVSDVRAAQQLGGIIVLPIILVLMLGSLFAFMPADLLALVMSGVLAIAAVALFYVSKATFQREEILTRWK